MAATGQAIERLYRLTVDATQANRQLTKINRNTSKIAGGFSAIQRASAAAFSALGAVRGLGALTAAGDQLELLEGSFEALTGSAERAGNMTERVFRTVAETGASLEDTSSTFQRLTIGFQELGGTNAQIDAVANTFIKLGRISGTSMFDTNAALVQFSQGLASGKLQGDELRSIMERLPLITRLIADEYSRVNDNMTVTRGMVKQLGREGKISAEIMGNALLRASEDIANKFSNLVFTLEQEINVLKSTSTQLLADLSERTGIGDSIKEGISAANQALLDFQRNIGTFTDDMVMVYNKSLIAKGAIVGLATVITGLLIPSVFSLSRALLTFSLSNPFTAFALATTVAITAIIANWDTLKPFLLYEVPSWLYDLQGKWYDFWAAISISTQNTMVDIENFFIEGFETIVGKFAYYTALLRGKNPTEFQFDTAKLKAAGEAVSDFTAKAQNAYTKSTAAAIEYDNALKGIIATGEGAGDDVGLFGSGGAIGSLGDAKLLEKISEGLNKLKEKVLTTINPMRELESVMADLHFLMGLGLLSEDQVNQYISLMDGTAEAAEKSAEAAAKSAQEWEKFGIKMKDAVDPMQAILREFAKVDMALEEGIISPQLAEDYKNHLLDMEEASRSSTDRIVGALERIKDATDGFAREFTDTLVEGLKTGELAFDDFAESILETMAKIVLNSIFEKFFAMVFAGITGSFSTGSSGGGGFGGGPFAATLSSSSSDGNAVGVLQAPTYGKGALGGSSSGLVNVTVNNNAPVDVGTETRENDNGGIDIDIYIERKVTESINNGSMDKAMRSNYGLARRAF